VPVFIDHHTVERLLTWPDCIDLLEAMSRHEAQGATFVSPKFNADFRGGSMRILFAADYMAGFGATKAYHTVETVGTRYLVSLIELRSGRQLAIVDGRPITDFRTGAASGVVARKVPIAGRISVGVLGSGHQARAQLACLAAVYAIGDAAVFSPTAENRERFCREMGEALGFPVRPAATAEEAVRDRPVVAAASKSRAKEPILRGEWLRGCRLLCAVGNTRPQFHEIDRACLGNAALVVVDSLHAFEEAGELIDAAAAGLLPPAKRSTLAAVAAGETAIPAEGMVVFKSVGTALQDLALAGHCYRAVAGGAGLPIFPDLHCSG
jgi:ornithine cyclodeaminase/alanine dehydrogenase